MKMAVIGAGMMGSAAAYDMARAPGVAEVTLIDSDGKRAADVARHMNRLSYTKKIHAYKADAAQPKSLIRILGRHNAALSCVPYFYNFGLAKAAIEAGCHFGDCGGNNTIVRQELALGKKAEKEGVAIAPDCGLSPGMASILAGELMSRIGGRADALKIYVGGLPLKPQPPFHYQLVFSPEGLINEYVEPCRILRGGKIIQVEPLTELETFHLAGFPPLDAFHTSGGTSTLPDSYKGKVGECFEKTLRYQGNFPLIRGLFDLGLFSSSEVKLGKAKMVPRQLMSRLFVERMSGNNADLVILRVEAHKMGRVAAFTIVDQYDKSTRMTAMMRTTAWPASIVVQMLASGMISKRGAIHQEMDVPFEPFWEAMAARGVSMKFTEGVANQNDYASISAGA